MRKLDFIVRRIFYYVMSFATLYVAFVAYTQAKLSAYSFFWLSLVVVAIEFMCFDGLSAIYIDTSSIKDAIEIFGNQDNGKSKSTD